jgi:hypothetical protein
MQIDKFPEAKTFSLQCRTNATTDAFLAGNEQNMQSRAPKGATLSKQENIVKGLKARITICLHTDDATQNYGFFWLKQKSDRLNVSTLANFDTRVR